MNNFVLQQRYYHASGGEGFQYTRVGPKRLAGAHYWVMVGSRRRLPRSTIRLINEPVSWSGWAPSEFGR